MNSITTHAQKITACAFLYKDRKLFIAKRAETKQFLPGKYELPGGHIEFGETMEKGLQREFKEEFGVEIIVEDPFYVFTYTRKKDDANLHVIEVIYFAKLTNENQNIQLNFEDHSEYKWIKEEEINTYLNQDDEETKAIRKGFILLNNKNTPQGTHD